MSHVFERYPGCLQPLEGFPVEAIPVVISAAKAILSGKEIVDKKAAALCATTLSWYPLQLWLEKEETAEGLGAEKAKVKIPKGQAALLQAGLDELKAVNRSLSNAKGARGISWLLIFAFAKKILDILGPFLQDEL